MKRRKTSILMIAVPTWLFSEAGISATDPLVLYADKGNIVIANEETDDYICGGDCENCPVSSMDCSGDCEVCPCIDLCEDAEVI